MAVVPSYAWATLISIKAGRYQCQSLEIETVGPMDACREFTIYSASNSCRHFADEEPACLDVYSPRRISLSQGIKVMESEDHQTGRHYTLSHSRISAYHGHPA